MSTIGQICENVCDEEEEVTSKGKPYEVTHRDFSRLYPIRMQWGVVKDRYRFETDENEEVNFTFQHAYFLGDNYSSVIFAKMFLVSKGYKYQVLWDTTLLQWLIVTNYNH